MQNLELHKVFVSILIVVGDLIEEKARDRPSINSHFIYLRYVYIYTLSSEFYMVVMFLSLCWRYCSHFSMNIHCQAEAELISSIITFFKRIGITASDVGFKVSSRKV